MPFASALVLHFCSAIECLEITFVNSGHALGLLGVQMAL